MTLREACRPSFSGKGKRSSFGAQEIHAKIRCFCIAWVCGQAMFLQDGTLVEPMQQLLLGTAEPHNKPFNGKVSICQQMSGVQVHRVLRVVNPALWRAYWERKAKLRGGRSGRIQPLPKTQEMKHLETIAFEVAPDQKTLGATYWILRWYACKWDVVVSWNLCHKCRIDCN